MRFTDWLKIRENDYDAQHDPESVHYIGTRPSAAHGGDPSATSTYIGRHIQPQPSRSQTTIDSQITNRLNGIEQRLARVEQKLMRH